MSITNVGSTLYSDAVRAMEAARKDGAARKTGKTDNAAGTGFATDDKVTISSRGSGIGRLVELAKAAPEVDSERVAELKSALEDGSLKVDSRELAGRMFREMSFEEMI